jgi:nitrite reductase/ring-hydroxylating ferredoxin subunit
MLSQFTKVATTSDLADGRMMAVDAENEEILLARIGDNYYAINNICSHAAAWLDQGYLLPATCEVQCPLHEGKFDLRNGDPTAEPCEEAVESYAVRIEGNDILVGPREG